MRQKLAKTLRASARELTSDLSLITFPQRRWAEHSFRANYRKLKRVLLAAPRPERPAQLLKLKESLGA